MQLRVVVNRIASGVLVLFLVSILAFGLIHMLPGDAAEAIAGDFATPEDVDKVRVELGLDKPVVEQYVNWLGDALQGDFGESVAANRPSLDLIIEAAPPTLSITFVALVVAAVFGIPLGLIAALNRGRWWDRAVSSIATLGIAMPSFWALMLLLVPFTMTLRWFPPTGYAPIGDGLWPWLSHILLPATALGLAVGAEMARHTRGCVIDVLESPYIRAAEARGARGWWLVRRHVMRNAAIPVVTVFGLQVGRLLGGSIVIESVAGVAGLGTLAIRSILQRDLVTIQAYVLFTAVIVVLTNLIVDLLYGWINPKVRS